MMLPENVPPPHIFATRRHTGVDQAFYPVVRQEQVRYPTVFREKHRHLLTIAARQINRREDFAGTFLTT